MLHAASKVTCSAMQENIMYKDQIPHGFLQFDFAYFTHICHYSFLASSFTIILNLQFVFLSLLNRSLDEMEHSKMKRINKDSQTGVPTDKGNKSQHGLLTLYLFT